jgi:hypothetical protein
VRLLKWVVLVRYPFASVVNVLVPDHAMDLMRWLVMGQVGLEVICLAGARIGYVPCRETAPMKSVGD